MWKARKSEPQLSLEERPHSGQDEPVWVVDDGRDVLLTWGKGVSILLGLVLACVMLFESGIWQYSNLFPEPQPAEIKPQPQDNVVAKDNVMTIGPVARPTADAALAMRHLPEFDIVRVEPFGDTLVAGRAEPKAQVELWSDTKILAQTEADSSGLFILQPEPLSSGDYSLSLRMVPKDGEPRQSIQSVTVSVPEKSQGKVLGSVMVALTEPGKPTVLLSDPMLSPRDSPRDSASDEGAAKPPVLAFKTAEIDPQSGFLTSGQAPPRANLRLYFNNSFIAKVTAGEDGKWSLKLAKGLRPGHYDLRVDQILPSGAVIARAEIPFDFPKVDLQGQGAARKPQIGSLSEPKDADTGPNKAIDQLKTAKVEHGDSLWRISKKLFGSGSRYTEIYAANNGQIRDPHFIYPGQVFIVPKERE
jgi:hypothetical protein